MIWALAMRALAVMAVLLAGCSASTTGTGGSGGTGGTAGGAGGSGGGTADAGTGGRTLATCATSIDSAAPEFFKRYFRCVTIAVNGTHVVITSTSEPPHKSNYWGTASVNYAPFDASRGAMYMANPNTLSAQNVKLTIPLTPTSKGLTINAGYVDGVVGSSNEEFPLGPVGVALDSVAMFNPLAAPGMNIEDEKYTFDDYNAHPTNGGAYHYHTASKGPLEVLTATGVSGVELYGIMCDGTVVLGCTELNATTAPTTGLDAQGGHTHDLVDAAGTTLLAGRYHVHVCPATAGARKYTPEIQAHSTCTRQ